MTRKKVALLPAFQRDGVRSDAMEVAFYAVLILGPFLLLVLHLALFASYVGTAIWAMIRLGWARVQVVLYATWGLIAGALLVSSRPSLVYDMAARTSHMHEALSARLNGQPATYSRKAAVDWHATVLRVLAMPPLLYWPALVLCILGLVMAVKWRVERQIGRFFDELTHSLKNIAQIRLRLLHCVSESRLDWGKLREKRMNGGGHDPNTISSVSGRCTGSTGGQGRTGDQGLAA